MVAGDHSGQGGNDHRKARFGFAHPGGVPDPTPTCSRSGTPAGVRDLFHTVTRRSPPPENPRRPRATVWQPFGLTGQECPNLRPRAECAPYHAAICLLVAAFALLAAPARAATNDLTSAIQRGLFEEEANQNLGAAIQAYQAVASQFDKDRKLAATAIFRLGECYRKQGNTNDAAAQYERILREFSDQPTLVTLSRQTLAALGSAPAAPASAVISDAARQEQKRLLEQEIKLVQKQLEEQQKRVEVGALPSDSLFASERELLKLKRQLAALDAGLPVSIAASETSAPTASSEADEVRRIQALIKESPDLINAPDRKGETLLQAAAAKGKLAVVKLLLDSGAAVDGLQQPGLTGLHYAAGNGHKAIVDLLLSKGAKADAQTVSGVTPLHLAVRKGYEAVAKALMAAGAPVNARSTASDKADTEDLQFTISSGQTPLHLAAIAGYAGLVELLLAKGADVDATDEPGRTPLSYAMAKHSQPIVQLLLSAHANPNAGASDLPLAEAAYYGEIATLKLLLANGADPTINTNLSGDFRRIQGMPPYAGGGTATPLAVAVSRQHPDAVAELIRAKADPNGSATDGTPLIFVALSDTPTLKALLEGGADPNRPFPAGASSPQPPGMSQSPRPDVTPLYQAVLNGQQPAVELLLTHHADVNWTANDRWTPLLAAASGGKKAIIELLLKAGAQVSARTQEDWTPLHLVVRRNERDAAQRRNQREVAELLLANKADPNAKDNGGYTPLHLAVNNAQPELVELLLASHAEANAKNHEGQTPLHVAVRNANQELAELLLANKADPNERDNSGKTPLDLAKGIVQQRQGMPPGTIPSYPGQIMPPTSAQQSKFGVMPDLLRRHGALDDLPRLDQIGIRRSAVGVSGPIFTKGSQDWSQFTLLELLAVHYSFLASQPDSAGGDGYSLSAFTSKFSGLPFPDLAHLHIGRPTADLKGWQDEVFDLRPVLESGDCAKDVRLRWGDVVEIPEADHPLNEKWAGFSETEVANLKKCLTRKLEIVVKGQTTTVTLMPRIMGLEGHEGRTPVSSGGLSAPRWEPTIYASTPFWLRPVLLQSKLVLISSDLSRVKVTRRDQGTGQKREWVVDCSQGGSSAPNLWLQDGDRIEVPEKTSAFGAQAERAQPSLAASAINPQTGMPRAAVPGIAPPPSAPATQAPQSGLRTQLLRAVESPGRVIHETALGTAQPIQDEHLSPQKVRYSPKPDDPALLNAGYRKDRSARTRKAEFWEERAAPDLRGRAGNTAVWTGSDMIVFGGEGQGTSFEDGARYCLAEDTWAMLPDKGAPSSRTGQAAVWTGKEMIIWGGFGGVNGEDVNHDDGARYNPASDTWKPVSTKNAPAARFDFSAVWTGKEMLVWGGYTDSHSRYQGGHADAHLNTGGRYDASSDSWKAITTRGAPSKRCGHSMVWTGKEMIVWGGGNANKVLNDGGRYSPSKDAWKPVSTDGAPGPRGNHVAVWTGKEMIVWGGSTREPGAASDYFVNGARYNPETDTWKPMSTIGAPKGRIITTAVWTGTEMVLWGGVNDAQDTGGRFVGTGARYNPATDTWTEITTQGAPSPRLTSGVWTGEGLLTFGGYDGTHLNETWLYSPLRMLYPYVKQ